MREFNNLWLPDEVLEAFPPDREELFRLIASETTDEMLWEIAKSDSYNRNPAANFVALRSLRDGGDDFPEEAWIGEAMSLFLHRPFDERLEGWDHRQFQVARAFCACPTPWPLRRDDSVFDDPQQRQTLSVLLTTCAELGAPFPQHLAGLLVWSIRHIGSNHREYLTEVFALFSTVARGAALDDERAGLLAQWIDRLSDEYAVETIATQLQGPDPFERRVLKWRDSGIRDLRDRLPPESELRYTLDQVLTL